MAKRRRPRKPIPTTGVSVQIEGLRELRDKFNGLDHAVAGILEDAAEAGAEVIREDANQRAPGPHIKLELEKSTRNYSEVHIGPDSDHWYYCFFETGVQPFTINKISGRTTRTSGRGRPVRGTKKAMAFDNVVTKVINRGPMAAEPFLRPAFDAKQDDAVKAVGKVLKPAIEKMADSG